MKIAIAGTGYVGLSLAVLLAQHNKVKAVDIVSSKIELINKKISPIVDNEIENFLSCKTLDLIATLDGYSAYRDADFVVIATPTNYDVERNQFDTSSIDDVGSAMAMNRDFFTSISASARSLSMSIFRF